jgi:hypothetical protein
MPEISITGAFGVKPADREADLIVSATAAEAHGAALFADEEHDRFAAVVIMHAGDEGVTAFNAMHEPLLAQKVERAINGDRRDARSAHRQPIDQLIGAEWQMACKQRLQHAAAHRREPLIARGANRFGTRDRVAGATAMVVIGRRKYRAQICLSGQAFAFRLAVYRDYRRSVKIPPQPLYIALQQKWEQVPAPIFND